MSVYKKFEPTDILNYTLHTSPMTLLASGTNGWRGSVGTSSSLSLYGGIRSRELVFETHGLRINPIIRIPTHTIDGLRTISSSYPYTGSVSLVKLHKDSSAQETNTDWGEKHWGAIENLYDYYSRYDPDYTTASYDYYAIFSERQTMNKYFISSVPSASSSIVDAYNFSSSYHIEMWINPVRPDLGNDAYDPVLFNGYQTLAAQSITNKRWRFFVSGSKLVFSASDGRTGFSTSSIGLTAKTWQHVSYGFENGTGSFTINLQDAGTHTIGSGRLTSSTGDPLITVLGAGNATGEFHGSMFEFRVWKKKRTDAQLSSSYNKRITNPSLEDDLVLYLPFNDGPLGTKHGFTAGSGAYDYSRHQVHASMSNWYSTTRVVPSAWYANDNPNFYAGKTLLTYTPTVFQVVHIPSLFYGRQIRTGSVELTCNAFLSSSLRRTIVDDGRGGLYISGSIISGSNSYEGVKWNKVGNVFYSEGLLVLTDPSLIDLGEYRSTSALHMTNDLVQLRFAGIERIPTKVFMCRVDGAEFNASENPTYSNFNSATGRREIIREDAVTYITSVGLYNEEHELVGVAKVAQPIRNREKDRLNLRIKLDF